MFKVRGMAGGPPEPTDPAIRFWKQLDHWPIDPPGYIFLGRAVLELGKKFYGEAWNDHARATEIMRPLPEHLSIYMPSEVLWRGVSILRTHCSSFRDRSGSDGPALLAASDVFPTQEEWAVAVEIAKAKAESSRAELQTFYSVVFHVVDAFRRDVLKCATRAFAGGEMKPQQWHLWNAEKVWFRFDTCRVDLSDPFSVDPPGVGEWIFCVSEDFRTLCDAAGSSSPPKSPEAEAVVAKKRKGGRRRAPEYDLLVAYFVQMDREGKITPQSTDSEIARELLDRTALVYENTIDFEIVRKRVGTWRQPLRSSGKREECDG